MKKILFSVLFACMAMTAMAQATDSTDVKNEGAEQALPKLLVADKPEFPGGREALDKYLHKNVRYPDLASDYGVEGSVVMHFTVGADGKPTDITARNCKVDRFNTTKFSSETEARQKELRKQFALLFAKEGARVIRKMPKWTPAKVNGKNVPASYELIIRFYDISK